MNDGEKLLKELLNSDSLQNIDIDKKQDLKNAEALLKKAKKDLKESKIFRDKWDENIRRKMLAKKLAKEAQKVKKSKQQKQNQTCETLENELLK